MLSQQDFDFIRTLVERESGIRLEADKRYLVEANLRSLASERGLRDVGELMAKLREGRDRTLMRLAIESMTIHESSFFRDRHPFEALRARVIPELVRARGKERTLRIWSAAAATGQEAYSIAITLMEHFPALAGWRIEILGTDIAQRAVRRASEGLYGPHEVRRGLNEELLKRYFRRERDGWRVTPRLRRWVQFRTMNLVAPWPMLPRMDVIFLRNVLIYFDLETRNNVLAKIRRVIADDGWLFLGATETTLRVGAEFETVRVGPTVCYRPRKVEKRRVARAGATR